jgi:putative FmdB family regulatory protein
MIRYEWRCSKCQKITEVTCAMVDRDIPPTETSPECEHEWKRLLTTGGFVLQGGGWARDSYGSGLKVEMS